MVQRKRTTTPWGDITSPWRFGQEGPGTTTDTAHPSLPPTTTTTEEDCCFSSEGMDYTAKFKVKYTIWEAHWFDVEVDTSIKGEWDLRRYCDRCDQEPYGYNSGALKNNNGECGAAVCSKWERLPNPGHDPSHPPSQYPWTTGLVITLDFDMDIYLAKKYCPCDESCNILVPTGQDTGPYTTQCHKERFREFEYTLPTQKKRVTGAAVRVGSPLHQMFTIQAGDVPSPQPRGQGAEDLCIGPGKSRDFEKAWVKLALDSHPTLSEAGECCTFPTGRDEKAVNEIVADMDSREPNVPGSCTLYKAPREGY